MPGSDTFVWTDSWIPPQCFISSSQSTRKEMEEHAKKYPFNVWSKVERKLAYIGTLKKPISNKEYMYRIDNSYYECYIFGQKLKERLTYNFKVIDGITFIDILAITDHSGVKNRKGKLNSELKDEFEYDDDISDLLEWL